MFQIFLAGNTHSQPRRSWARSIMPGMWLKAGVGLAALVANLAGLAIAFPPAPISEEVVVDAPREEVWNAVYDMSSWASWNKVFSVSTPGGGPPKLDDIVEITCSWSDGSTDVARERITEVAAPRQFGWQFTELPQWALATDRGVTLESIPGGGTRVINYEKFGGLLGHIVVAFKGKVIKDGFGAWNQALAAKFRE